jgi:CRP-like cAMP-binding protein
MPATPDPSAARDRARANYLLRALPEGELDQLLQRGEIVELDARHVLFEAGDSIDSIYFPITAVLSQLAIVDGESVIEVTTIGREGMSGLTVFLGGKASPNTVVCQIPGEVVRLPSAALPELLSGDGTLHDVLHRFTQATIVLLAQSVACNRAHSIEERAGRWLLMTHDRVDTDTFGLTQEFLAQMLGVRRATVSVTQGVLQSAGLIRYSRGRITIVDRDRLEDAACECYRIIRDEFRSLADL